MEWELAVCRGEGTYKMILECLYRTFGRIDAVVEWFDEQEFALLRGEEAFYLLAGLVVHDVYL